MASEAWGRINAIPNGKTIFNHGADECVALANYYTENLLGLPFVQVGSAYQWWTQRRNLAALRDHYTETSRPVTGALFVSRGGVYDAVNGHIGIVTSVRADGSFTTIEQNAGTPGISRHTRANDDSVYGFLIPNHNPAASPAAPMSEEDDVIYIRTSNQGAVWPWNPITRKTSAKGLTPAEWNAIKAAHKTATGGLPPITNVSAATFKAMTGHAA